MKTMRPKFRKSRSSNQGVSETIGASFSRASTRPALTRLAYHLGWGDGLRGPLVSAALRASRSARSMPNGNATRW
jgi:hypothetical protein